MDRVCLTAVVAGVFIGFSGGAFRWCLETADRLRVDFVDWTHALPGPGWLVPWPLRRPVRRSPP